MSLFVFSVIHERSVYFTAFAGMTLMRQRPTAKDLLKHKFIKNAKKATYLTELIERNEKYKEGKPEEDKPDLAGTIG